MKKVEYLIVTQQDDSFCDNANSFNNLLQANTQINIQDETLKFTQGKKTLEVDYILETDVIKDKKQRYFHIKLIADDDSQIEFFTILVRTIRKIVEKLNSNISINTLWDDISIYYIVQAYPLINEVENLMRKLILKFMLVNVGMDWINQAMDSDLKKKIAQKAETNNSKNLQNDTLHNADFIQLSNFLFERWRARDFKHFDKIIENKKLTDTVTFSELKKEFYPVSNWDRYFSDLINYEGKLLEEKWKDLYDLRNKIAHNKNFNKGELEKVQKSHKEIVEKLTETINKLDKIKIDEQQKQNIVDSYQHTSKNNNDIASSNAYTIYFDSEITLAEFKAAEQSIKRFLINEIELAEILTGSDNQSLAILSKFQIPVSKISDMIAILQLSGYKITNWRPGIYTY